MTLLRVRFTNANLTGANLSFSDVRGASFTGAILTNAAFQHTKFDGTTVWPMGFTPPVEMNWVGAGPHPGKMQTVVHQPTGSMDCAAFVKGLRDKLEAARVAKAMAMLKADTFRLFADVTHDTITGVVKSQTAADLVYSCRLASNGEFACGTQNLRPCGGLNGSLCKHLIVLIVGLVKAGEVDPATVDNWVNTSRVQTPRFDPDALSATFLKYKGAEAGTVDWRPTETIPEDFYAM
jgi:hypothetical protein